MRRTDAAVSVGACLATVLLLIAAGQVWAQTAERLLFDIGGGNGGLAVSGSGEWFIKTDSGSDYTWTHMGNLFQASGVETNGRIVSAIATYSVWGLFVLCEDGPFFFKNASPTLDAAAKDNVWALAGNVFEAAGRNPPGGATISSFVVHGGAGCDLVLSNGDWYDKGDAINHFDWRYLGNIYAMAGVVPVSSQTLGSLKRSFH